MSKLPYQERGVDRERRDVRDKQRRQPRRRRPTEGGHCRFLVPRLQIKRKKEDRHSSKTSPVYREQQRAGRRAC